MISSKWLSFWLTTYLLFLEACFSTDIPKPYNCTPLCADLFIYLYEANEKFSKTYLWINLWTFNKIIQFVIYYIVKEFTKNLNNLMYLIALPLLVYSGTQVSTKKTESHDITEIFSKLALNSITPNTPQYLWLF
jgi:hypothetical protein